MTPGTITALDVHRLLRDLPAEGPRACTVAQMQAVGEAKLAIADEFVESADRLQAALDVERVDDARSEYAAGIDLENAADRLTEWSSRILYRRAGS